MPTHELLKSPNVFPEFGIENLFKLPLVYLSRII